MRRKATILSFVLLLAVLFSGCTGEQNPLPQPAEPQEREISTTELRREDTNLSVLVPLEWSFSETDGVYVYTEPATGTELTIVSESYQPYVNNVSANSIQTSAANAGMTAKSFNKPSGDRFNYVLSEGDASADKCEYGYVYWTYSQIYTISFVSENRYSSVFMDYYEAAVNSISPCSAAETITENFAGYYNESAGVYLEYPYFWEVSAFTSGFSVTSPDTATVITVDFISAMENFDTMTELEYQALMRSSIQNISLLNYNNSNGQIGAELTFTEGDYRYYVRNYLINRGSFVINLTFVADTNYTETDYPAFQTMLDSLVWEE